jgi:hypothetical protein
MFSWALTPCPSPSLEEVGRERGEERKIKERDRVVSLFPYRDRVLST